MKTTLRPAMVAALLSVVLAHMGMAQTLNVSQAASTPAESHQTGWRDGPGERGTLTILWSCLTTIIACTWTILHLNVPHPYEGLWTRLVRKVKWMVITILFPEFIFSKAVCELQMAVEGLEAMSNIEDLEGWKVDFGWGPKLLFKFFKPLKKTEGPEKQTTGSSTEEIRRSEELSSQSEGRPADAKGIAAQGVEGQGHTVADSDSIRPIHEDATVLHRQSCDPMPYLSWTPDIQEKQTRLPTERILFPHYYALEDSRRTWTLTHSYFANMGGLAWSQAPNPSDGCHEDTLIWLITAHSLTSCCLKYKHSFLPKLQLSVDEINEKAKADWLVKTIALVQIGNLILSVITRAVRRLPINQLEVCTAAFAALAVATYAASWSKPKDVERPILIPRSGDFTGCAIGLSALHFEPFFGRLLFPRDAHRPIWKQRALKLPGLSDEQSAEIQDNRRWIWSHRIRNDSCNAEWRNTGVPVVTYWLAISTMVFGGLHCAAWSTEFPTVQEKIVWLCASILSATLPLLNLVLTILWNLHRRFSKLGKRWKRRAAQIEQCKYDGPNDSDGVRIYRYGFLYVTSTERPSKHLMKSLSTSLLETARYFHTFIHKFPNEYHLSVLFSVLKDTLSFYRRLRNNNPFIKRVGASSRLSHVEDLGSDDADAQRDGSLLLKELLLVIDSMEDPDLTEIWDSRRAVMNKVRSDDRMIRFVTICCGILYAIVRLLILVLAFAALRRQDERLYVETWAKNLPKIG